MDRPFLAGALRVAVALAAVGAVAAYLVATSPRFAQVVSVEPVTRPATVTALDCSDMRAARARASKDPILAKGIVIGGMVGGLIEQGAAGRLPAGLSAARAATRPVVDRDAELEAQPGCRTVRRVENRIIGYEVRYRFEGRLGEVRMQRPPASRIPVIDGKLVLPPPLPEGEPGEA